MLLQDKPLKQLNVISMPELQATKYLHTQLHMLINRVTNQMQLTMVKTCVCVRSIAFPRKLLATACLACAQTQCTKGQARHKHTEYFWLKLCSLSIPITTTNQTELHA